MKMPHVIPDPIRNPGVRDQIPASSGMTLKLILIAVILALTLAVYAASTNYGFIHLDDYDYVLDNPNVTNGITYASARWAFTTFYACNWHPLTWLSHMLDCEIFGLDARGHHMTNLLLHLASTLILFLLLHRATGSLFRSALVSAIFGVHPLHVESVAWISERKDVLSAFFWMCATWSYICYAQRPATSRYIPVLLFFAMGLMAKQMLVTLPFVFLLLDYWPLKRFSIAPASQRNLSSPGSNSLRFLLWEKAPLFALSAAASAVVYIAQHTGGATASFDAIPFITRLQNAVISYLIYILKTAWPINLAVFYPYPETISFWTTAGSVAVLLAITAAVLFKGRKFPYLPAGWLWYVGTLIPVIGLVQIGAQANADRYTYLPMIGLLILTVWGASDLATRLKLGRILTLSAAGAVLAVLTIAGYNQASYWRDSITLFTRTIAVTQNNWMAHNSLGSALKDAGRLEESFESYRKSIRIRPYFVEAHNNLGVALNAAGRRQEAADSFRTALSLKADYAEAHDNLGVVLAQQGMLSEALQHLTRALELRPLNAKAHNNMGNLLSMMGKRDDAISHYSEALRINPGHKGARKNLERLMQNSGGPSGSPFRRSGKGGG